jgi:hypothetical protein
MYCYFNADFDLPRKDAIKKSRAQKHNFIYDTNEVSGQEVHNMNILHLHLHACCLIITLNTYFLWCQADVLGYN